MSGYLRDVGTRPARPARDPLGKAALFSDDTRRPGTLVVECRHCGVSTRISYLDFVFANLPFAVWLPPLPNLPFNRKMTCPACDEWAWMRAHWLR
jgi:hypothetical protein